MKAWHRFEFILSQADYFSIKRVGRIFFGYYAISI